MTALPTVVVVGRPNVGKSTLINRIVGRQLAIVEDRPGITRDRKGYEAEWLGVPFEIVDTGGWIPGGNDLEEKVSRQVERAVVDADAVLFIVDASIGVTDDDEAVAAWLRRTGRKVILVANKADNDRRELDAWEFTSLGCGDPMPISALHGRRTGDMLDAVIAAFPTKPEPERVRLPKRQPIVTLEREAFDAEARDGAVDDGEALDGLDDDELEIDDLDDADEEDADADDEFGGGWVPDEDDPKIPAVAIIGRPNVGKSTLFNRLIGEDRAVVHDMPGTTRDAIDTIVDTPSGPIKFVDTAGMRKKSKMEIGAEYYSYVRALRAVDAADIALLVIDATEGVTAQDQRLAERIDAAGCPLVVLLNKWELLDDAERREQVMIDLHRLLHFIGDAPVLKISARTGKGVHKLAPVLSEAIERYHRRVPTREVNKVITLAQQKHPSPNGVRVMYALQGATEPPTFTLFANKEIPPTYLRFLENRLRDAFDLGAVPIKMRVRRRGS